MRDELPNVKFAGRAKAAGSIECYDDKPEDAGRLIRETLKADGWEIEADALAYLAEALSVDRRLLRSELDKLVEAMFNGADSDKDGGVTMAELKGFKTGQWRKSYLGQTQPGSTGN